jgi:hypothetical protein
VALDNLEVCHISFLQLHIRSKVQIISGHSKFLRKN